MDRFLAEQFPTLPRAALSAAIERGDILLNQRVVRKSRRLEAGETVSILCLPPPPVVALQPNAFISLNILYADPCLLALDKPAGLPVHPLRGDETQTLANGLIAQYPELAGIGDNPLFPALIHRLDTDTSGVVIAARTPAAYAHLRGQIRAQTVRKTYQALVHGRVTESARLVHRLAHHPQHPGRMVIARNNAAGSGAFRAETHIAILRRFTDFTYLEVVIFTGVTHQIRCQLAAVNHPIAGDTVYCARKWRDRLPLARQFLHAAAIEFEHPSRGARIRIESPLPDELQRLLARGDL